MKNIASIIQWLRMKRCSFLLVAIIALSAATSATAEPVSWTGAKDSNLLDPDNWLGGVVPTAENGKWAIITVDQPVNLVCPSDFSPLSITFYGSGAATISGEGSISGITAITNNSLASHTINVPVYFTSGINVKQNAVAYDTIGNSHVTFAGGAYAASGKTIDTGYSVAVFGRYYFANTSSSRWTATEDAAGKRKAVARDSYLYVPYAGNMNNLCVAVTSIIDIGDVTHSVSDNRISWRNYGEMIITNLTFTGSGDRYVTSHQAGDVGTFKFEAVTNSKTGQWFYLGDATEAGNHVFYIGSGGMKFANYSNTPCFALGNKYAGNKTTIRPWHSDFTIADRAGGYYSLVLLRNVIFCTDDENGVGRTITIDARTRSTSSDSVPVAVTVSGSGKVKINGTCYNSITPEVTVTDTATLAIKTQAGLGEYAMTVNSGATLAVEESDDVTINGATTLEDGAILSFNFTSDKYAPKFVFLNHATANGTVKVKVSAAEGVFPRKLDGKWLIAEGVSGTFELDKGSLPAFATGVSVEDGNLYLNVNTAGRWINIK